MSLQEIADAFAYSRGTFPREAMLAAIADPMWNQCADLTGLRRLAKTGRTTIAAVLLLWKPWSVRYCLRCGFIQQGVRA